MFVFSSSSRRCYSHKEKIYKLLRFATWRAIGFWHVVAGITDGLLLAAFVLRVSGIVSSKDRRDDFRLQSFQILSFVSPFIWWVLSYS